MRGSDRRRTFCEACLLRHRPIAGSRTFSVEAAIGRSGDKRTRQPLTIARFVAGFAGALFGSITQQHNIIAVLHRQLNRVEVFDLI
jgi:hypothetical protein